MKTYLLYNKNTPGERAVADLAKELERAQVEVELMDADSPRGIQLAENYDILGRPAVVLVRDDGSPVQAWQGPDGLPSAREVSYHAHQ